MLLKYFFAAALICTTLQVFAQRSPLERKYKAGDKYRYKLTCTEYHNDELKSTVISVCELRVVKDSNGTWYDEVRWLSKETITKTGTTDQSNDALLVKPYRISLQPEGKLELPPVEIPSMTQPMQDFNTFFVAVSPHLGTTELKAAGDSAIKNDLVKADFSNGDFIVVGDDCFTIKMKIESITKESVMTRVEFLPPAEVCFDYLLDDMKIPVVDNTINNFQMVQAAGDDKFYVQYGREIFYINSVTQKKDGKITHATMDNLLSLKVKFNCDKTYANCDGEIPFTIQRNLELELLSEK